jgi:alpha-mannosidase
MQMRLKAALLCGWIVLFVAGIGLSATAQQSSQNNTVFRIGTFDRSSAEFAQEPSESPVKFVVNESNSAKDWPATQPAEVLSPTGTPETGRTSAPRVITFSLDHAPAAAYQLHISFLIESPSVPAIRVSVNGKHGMFYLHPKLDYGGGDMMSSFYPAYSSADVLFPFPGSLLQQGANTITLQAIEEEEKVVPDAGLTYDAVELDRDPSPKNQDASSAQIVPTIFYKQQGQQLQEMVDVFIRYGKPVTAGDGVDLTIAGKHYHQALRGNQEFGEEKLQFAVTEFPAKSPAQLTWNAEGRRQHKEAAIDPGKKWTLLMVPHIHLDVGYTDYQAKVAAIQSRVIDEAMDLTAQHPDFRFSIDGEWDLEQFLKTRTPAEQQRAITAVQKQQLFVPAQYGSLLTGFSTAETLIRSLYASANFSREHGTPFNYANITDVPSYSWSYASILASAGLKYFLAGSDNVRAPVLLQGRLNENSPFWWEGPDGQKVLLWYSRHYMQMQLLFGLPPEISAGHDTIPLFLQMYEQPNYRANAAIIFGSQVENTDLFPQQAELAGQWNNVFAFPRMQYSGFYDALKNIADQFGTDIPTVRGDGGPYWEDGMAADAYYAAIERENESRAPSAEKLATLTSLVNPNLAADKGDLERIWTHMILFDEHTWTASNSITDPTSLEVVHQLAVKDSHAVDAEALVASLVRNSMASIVDSIYAGKGSLIVFNPLNWKRSGSVSIDLINGDEIVDPLTGQVVPVENVPTGKASHHIVPLRIIDNGKSFNRVRFFAQDVPALGYKVYVLRPGGPKQAEAAQVVQHGNLENDYYRIELDPATGAVRSIYDKQLQRELVNAQSPYRFGEYLYVSGGDNQPNTLLQFPMVAPKAELQIEHAHGGRPISIDRTPDGWVARMESTSTNTPAIATQIRLFDHQKKIEFTEDVDKKEIDDKEAVYFAFPFAMQQPQFQYEIQNGVVDPSKDMYAGAGHEWFNVQHWISAQQNGMSATVMPLDVPLVTLGDINRGEWPTQFGNRPGTIFSYVMNNYWFTNYRAGQGGHFHFRYIVTSAPSTDPIQLSRMGWEEMTPFETDEVTSQDKALNQPRPLDGKQGSFLDVQDPNLLLETWKPAEDGKGTILRFLDFGGTTRAVTVQCPLLQIEGAWQTDAVERNGKQLSLAGSGGFQFTIHPHEILTIRLVSHDLLKAPTI